MALTTIITFFLEKKAKRDVLSEKKQLKHAIMLKTGRKKYPDFVEMFYPSVELFPYPDQL